MPVRGTPSGPPATSPPSSPPRSSACPRACTRRTPARRRTQPLPHLRCHRWSPTSPKAVSSSRRRKTLMQIQQGDAVPVTHGTTPLQADGTLLGRRLAALIALRDHARRVLQSQNEGWPEAQRQEARRALNRVYDRFVAGLRPDQQDDHLDHRRTAPRSGACPTS